MKENKDLGELLAEKGRIFEELGRIEDAVDCYEQMRLVHGFPGWDESRRIDQFLDQHLSQGRRAELFEWFHNHGKAAELYEAAGDKCKAYMNYQNSYNTEGMERVLASCSEDEFVMVYSYAAKTLEKNKEYYAAAEYYMKLIETDPGNEREHLEGAIRCLEDRRNLDALKLAERLEDKYIIERITQKINGEWEEPGWG
jgi:tetratricopeptide (TPR) repeat protein